MGANVTLLCKAGPPMGHVLGARVGRRVSSYVAASGVKILEDVQAAKFIVDERSGLVHGVELDNGEVIGADFVLLGVGADANSSILQDAQVLKDPDGTVACDPMMRSLSFPDSLFAAGDVASFPCWLVGSKSRIRVGHWNVATQTGRIAAAAMVGKFKPLNEVPFFWIKVGDKTIRYAGHAPSFDDVVVEGDLEAMNFVAYYLKDDRVLAVATCDMDPVAVGACEAFKRNLLPSGGQLKLGAANSQTILESIKSK
eukprot:GHVT01063419.1.p1 GENE.GHVT01063419.1~~GHVT01063419.1.p1  ORF type:complete len:255 (-),score=54.26 GHVT01063419.1:767-1531(-)